ncbi:MAG: branched-chain amino acid transport system II carrier protein, partial [Oscillibacter sp.]|nr:branched-chain amino acid transport system II carrier protein [Oscillibacter sp.]
FGGSREVYVSVTACTFAAALLDLIKALPGQLGMTGLLSFASAHLPLFDLGLGWICPALVGLVVGLIWKAASRKK